uniref:Uncharacterized protein n=1 Tax=Callorhinchus milii TaxID=7868 RepID=A0A4W3GXD5_CALMI
MALCVWRRKRRRRRLQPWDSAERRSRVNCTSQKTCSICFRCNRVIFQSKISGNNFSSERTAVNANHAHQLDKLLEDVRAMEIYLKQKKEDLRHKLTMIASALHTE